MIELNQEKPMYLKTILLSGRPDDGFGKNRWTARIAGDRGNPREMRRAAIKALAGEKIGQPPKAGITQ
jgi:hypothetical protein